MCKKSRTCFLFIKSFSLSPDRYFHSRLFKHQSSFLLAQNDVNFLKWFFTRKVSWMLETYVDGRERGSILLWVFTKKAENISGSYIIGLFCSYFFIEIFMTDIYESSVVSLSINVVWIPVEKVLMTVFRQEKSFNGKSFSNQEKFLKGLKSRKNRKLESFFERKTIKQSF